MQLEPTLRASGLRVTRARRLVWDVLTETDRHLTAHEIAERVQARDPGINVSSVYRTLTALAGIELVRESRLGDSSTWERAHSDAHIHLVCRTCGGVQHHHASSIDELPTQLAAAVGFVPDGIDVRVTGVCERCVDDRRPP